MSHPSPPRRASEPADHPPPRRSCETRLRTELYVESGGERFPLAQACHLWLLPASGVDLPTGRVRVVSRIDGHTDAWEAQLDAPRSATDRRVPVRGVRVLAGSEAA